MIVQNYAKFGLYNLSSSGVMHTSSAMLPTFSKTACCCWKGMFVVIVSRFAMLYNQ